LQCAQEKSRDGQPKATVPKKSVLAISYFPARPCVASINNLDFCAPSFRYGYVLVDEEVGESLHKKEK